MSLLCKWMGHRVITFNHGENGFMTCCTRCYENICLVNINNNMAIHMVLNNDLLSKKGDVDVDIEIMAKRYFDKYLPYNWNVRTDDFTSIH